MASIQLDGRRRAIGVQWRCAFAGAGVGIAELRLRENERGLVQLIFVRPPHPGDRFRLSTVSSACMGLFEGNGR